MSALLIRDIERQALVRRGATHFQCSMQLDPPQPRILLPRRTPRALCVLQIAGCAVGEMNQAQAAKIREPRAEPKDLIIRMRGDERDGLMNELTAREPRFERHTRLASGWNAAPCPSRE